MFEWVNSHATRVMQAAVQAMRSGAQTLDFDSGCGNAPAQETIEAQKWDNAAKLVLGGTDKVPAQEAQKWDNAAVMVLYSCRV